LFSKKERFSDLTLISAVNIAPFFGAVNWVDELIFFPCCLDLSLSKAYENRENLLSQKTPFYLVVLQECRVKGS